jgi:hypothetical protein
MENKNIIDILDHIKTLDENLGEIIYKNLYNIRSIKKISNCIWRIDNASRIDNYRDWYTFFDKYNSIIPIITVKIFECPIDIYIITDKKLNITEIEFVDNCGNICCDKNNIDCATLISNYINSIHIEFVPK